MPHDLVIRHGTLVDGSGDAPRRADVAIDLGEITALGEVDAPGRAEIDATGMIVTPGFIDLHTHMDAQIGWDPLLTPLTWHGVTTALLGNCGVTFAPCRPGDREFLAEMMETVEDIPRDAILTGLPWDWEDYGGYLDSLERLRPAINVAGLVGHCAVRYYVMGERSIDAQPTPDELERIAQVVGESVAAGAVGFSTSRFLPHVLPDGRQIPGTFAEHAELVRIAQAVEANGGGLMQNILDLPGGFQTEFELLREEARATRGPVLFSMGCGAEADSGRRIAGWIGQLRRGGLDISAMAIPRSSGFVVGLQHILPWRGGPWDRLAKLDLARRLAEIAQPDARAELVRAARSLESPVDPTQLFWLGDGDVPDYTKGPEGTLQTLADAAGEHPAETFLRLALDSDGRALFTLRMFNRNLDACGDLISSEFCLPGLGDAGAHVGQVVDGGWCSFVLSHWVRQTGRLTIQEAVRRMTSAPARLIGLSDRGRLAPGLRADVNVIDAERVSEEFPEYVHDFPGGAGRYIQRARGYRATLCNGERIVSNDEHTGARAGSVLR